MKKLISIIILAVSIAVGNMLKAQDRPPEYLGLPGDNLNLYAVMKLFQESKTLEEFERKLNDKNTGIDNLDLNGDNRVDYISVIDNVDGDVHNIVLRDAINRNESQDIAVFTVKRFTDGGVQIQLTGDEALYGKNYIIEPNYEDTNTRVTPNPGYMGDNSVVYDRDVVIYRTTPYIIASWPLISFIFQPWYIPWHSRWYWGFYPDYWYSWTPFYWDFYYGFHYAWFNNYYGFYHRCDFHRFRDWDDRYYRHDREYSRYVSDRIHAGNYRNTYSHPEQRREGEALFNRTHPEQSRRTAYGSGSGNSGSFGKGSYRATGSSSVSDRRVVSNNASSYSGNQRSGSTSSFNHGISTYTGNRYAYNQRSSQANASERRPSSGISTRSSVNQRSSQSFISNRTGSNSGGRRSIAMPSTTRSFNPVRSSGQMRTSSVSSVRSGGNHSFSSGGGRSFSSGLGHSSSSIGHSGGGSRSSGHGGSSHRR